MPQRLCRAGTFALEEVFCHVFRDLNKNKTRIFLGRKVKMGSWRYYVFKEKGVKCVSCGIEGQFFALERFDDNASGNWHFNLYAVNNEGEEVLMTKDHIFPRSKGGRDHIDNLQTMCSPCNVKKGSKVLDKSKGDR